MSNTKTTPEETQFVSANFDAIKTPAQWRKAIEGLLAIQGNQSYTMAERASKALLTLCDQWQKDLEQQAELDTLDYVADALDAAGDSQGCMEAAAKANDIRLRMESTR